MNGAERSFVVFFYPFDHRLRGPIGSHTRKKNLLRMLDGSYRPWVSRLYRRTPSQSAEDAERIARRSLDAAYVFEPSTRQFIFPEVDDIDQSGRSGWRNNAKLWVDNEPAAKRMTEAPVARLTLRSKHLASWQRARLMHEGPDGFLDCEFSIIWCDAHLFPVGRGYLAMKVVPVLEKGETRRQIARFVSAFRTVLPNRLDWKLARFRTNDAVECLGSVWLDEFLEGLHDYGESYVEHQKPREKTGDFLSLAFCADAAAGVVVERGDLRDLDSLDIAAFELSTAWSVDSPLGAGHDHVLEALNTGAYRLRDAWSLVTTPTGMGCAAGANTRVQLAQRVEHDFSYLMLYGLYQRALLGHLHGLAFGDEEPEYEAFNPRGLLFEAYNGFRRERWVGRTCTDSNDQAMFETVRDGLGSNALMGAVSGEVHERQQVIRTRAVRDSSRMMAGGLMGGALAVMSWLLGHYGAMPLSSVALALGVVVMGAYPVWSLFRR